MPPFTNTANVYCATVATTMADMHTDLQASIRATLASGDELHQLSIIRQDNGNKVTIVYIWEDMTP